MYLQVVVCADVCACVCLCVCRCRCVLCTHVCMCVSGYMIHCMKRFLVMIWSFTSVNGGFNVCICSVDCALYHCICMLGLLYMCRPINEQFISDFIIV